MYISLVFGWLLDGDSACQISNTKMSTRHSSRYTPYAVTSSHEHCIQKFINYTNEPAKNSSGATCPVDVKNHTRVPKMTKNQQKVQITPPLKN